MRGALGRFSRTFLTYSIKGEGKWTTLRRHGLRNTLLPALTLQFASFAELFGGSVMAENVFSYPGLGSAVAAAGRNPDVPLLLGVTLPGSTPSEQIP